VGANAHGPAALRRPARAARRLAARLAASLWLFAASAAGAQEAPNGVLLIAKPDLVDVNFRETVVLATRHAGGGTVGVILNRPTPRLVSKMFPEYEALRGRPDHLFLGGPVSPRGLVALFRSKEQPAEALRILPDVYLGLAATLLDGLLRRPDAPRDLRLYVGYAGWAPGQLENEMTRNDWHILEPDAETIFRTDPATLWRTLLRRATSRSVDLFHHRPKG
jgi:putative transcriptional regulator